MMKTAFMAAAVLSSPTPLTGPGTPPSSGSTGAPAAGAAISREEIKSALERRGFSDVQARPGGPGGHRVTAVRDGERVRIEVDPTGRVTQSR